MAPVVSRILAAAFAALAAAASAVEDAAALQALGQDDECAAAAGDCALNALQVRGSRQPPATEQELGAPGDLEENKEVLEASVRPGYTPLVASLWRASSAKVFTYYIYRAMGEAHFPPENVNAANLPGVLWYLHNEVVIRTPRKFGITRIVRFKVSTKATQPLINAGMNFGVRYAFDNAQCTGPYDCNEQWRKYGYFVGCNNLGEFPFPTTPVAYPGAIWYSFPGDCPSLTLQVKHPACRFMEPGGACKSPTGTGDCTYSYQAAGEIKVDDLEARGGAHFWDGKDDKTKCQDRVALASKLFAEKYPDTPTDEQMQSPPCDFNYGRFYR